MSRRYTSGGQLGVTLYFFLCGCSHPGAKPVPDPTLITGMRIEMFNYAKASDEETRAIIGASIQKEAAGQEMPQDIQDFLTDLKQVPKGDR